jgi:hypothetical protein
MEPILRKRSREGKIEKVQTREKRTYQRNLRLSRFCGTKTFRDLTKIWQQWEAVAYMAVRHPEDKKEGMSLEYYLGFQNGLLSNIESNRKLFSDAQIEVFKEDQRKADEEDRNKEK